MLVTDIKRTLKNGKEVTGFYMDGYLKQNLDGVVPFLKKDWDCVGVVSGHGKVRIGKSSIASQTAFYLAWILAGGEVITNKDNQVVKVVSPTKEVNFNLQENVVFGAEDLQKRAVTLYDKYGPNQVLLYDEGRQGLDSKRAMESINKGMEDFFQECGFMGHVIIIVLPNFFKLHEDYAVARSLFLIDVFVDKKYNRGYFNFYNERQKEYLYYFGKKKIGVSAKYGAARESFWGRYGKWLPFDKQAYEKIKKEEMEKKRYKRREKDLLLQRNILIWILRTKCKYDLATVEKLLLQVGEIAIAKNTLQDVVTKVNGIISRKKDYGDD